MDARCWDKAGLWLDFSRDCTAGTSGKSCWLCSCLCDWNCMLNDLGLDLVEQRPGELCLSTNVLKPALDTRDLISRADLIAWLPRKHSCITALKLGKGDPSLLMVTAPDLIPQRGSNLRSIVIQEHVTFNWAIVLEAMGSMRQLEELEVSTHIISEELARKLAHLLSESAESMTKVDLSGSIIRSTEMDLIMTGMSKCRELKELKFSATFGSNGLADCLDLLLSAQKLETLYVMEDYGDPFNPAFDVSINVQRNNEQVLAAVGDLLRGNTHLRELRYRLYDHTALEDVFNALETNTVLQCLVITRCDFHPSHHESRIGTMLKAMLAENEALCSLTFQNCVVSLDAAVLVSEGLRENRNLQTFDVSTCKLDFPALQALCNALHQNATLRVLQVGSFTASLRERDLMSAELARNGWYKRVQMPWEDRDVPGLQAALRDQSLCPSHLTLSTDSFSSGPLSTLCAALSKSPYVEDVRILLRYTTLDGLMKLHEMLSNNRCLKSVSIEEDSSARGSLAFVAGSFVFNKSVTELTLKCSHGCLLAAEVISVVFNLNEALSKVAIRCNCIAPGFVSMVSDSMLKNRFITNFSFVLGDYTDCSREQARAVVKHNAGCLHRAACFALSPTVEKRCAEAFELFRAKPSLVPCIMSISHVNKAEAESAVQAARRFIDVHFLIITGVVRSSVDCYAGCGMQIDRLNVDCWLAIAKYLKISDVRSN